MPGHFDGVKSFSVHEVWLIFVGAVILTWVPSMNPMTQGKLPTWNKPSLMSYCSARVDGNLTQSPNFAVIECVTRQTTRVKVNSSNPRKVSSISCRNEPDKDLHYGWDGIVPICLWCYFVRSKVNDVLYCFSSKTKPRSQFRVSIRL